ncbi:MAG: UDP-N-acetylmuramate dehydrogenase [Rickettsiales bacterium]|nr:UDP-N-acetylmuramate dehydrogenase [Rickettsiales bacterium]
MNQAAATQSLEVLETSDFDVFRERLRPNADLSKTNWFGVGGPAQWLFRPHDTDELAAFLSLLPLSIPVTVLGVGSNVIVRDGGIDGVVIKLGRGFAGVDALPGHKVVVGAATLALNAALFACEEEIAGLEFLSGIPGTIGGVLRMNGGAYGNDASQVLIEAEIVERSGMRKQLTNEQMQFEYRSSGVPEGAIITQATMQGTAGKREEIADRIRSITEERETTQPVRTRTGGSTFKNPPNQKAWELIDRAGCRGLTIGGAQISEKHCNFMINVGGATAQDLETLGEEVRKRVKEVTNVSLEWEIKRIGKKKA